tara:strand:+ start:965 stop:1147 length:183 start_codon:yes stop_codon:yes gene_type:complete
LYLRKIQHIGYKRTTLAVNIPKEFVDKIGIRGGEYVEIFVSGSMICFHPIKLKEERKNEE